MRSMLRSYRSAGLLAGLTLFCTACTWSVPADPGRNSRERGRPEEAALTVAPGGGGDAIGPTAVARVSTDDAATRTLYMNKCGQCHEPFSPRRSTAAEWPALVRRYGPRAGLFGADRQRVLAWLQASSR